MRGFQAINFHSADLAKTLFFQQGHLDAGQRQVWVWPAFAAQGGRRWASKSDRNNKH